MINVAFNNINIVSVAQSVSECWLPCHFPWWWISRYSKILCKSNANEICWKSRMNMVCIVLLHNTVEYSSPLYCRLLLACQHYFYAWFLFTIFIQLKYIAIGRVSEQQFLLCSVCCVMPSHFLFSDYRNDVQGWF